MSRFTRMTRRAAIACGAAAGLAALPSPAPAAPEDGKSIDAHSHVWTPDTDRFPLVEGRTKQDLVPPSFTDDELMSIARPHGVGRVVLIQHTRYHLFDNTYLSDVVRRHPQRFRAVGMIDDFRTGAADTMKELLPQGFTGFRITPLIRQTPRETWLRTEGMQAMWKTGAETRQAMCCLIDPQDLPGVDAMCDKFPDTPVVVDHLARIGTDGQFKDEDLSNLCKLARHKLTYVKVSAFYALGKKKPPYLELVPVIKRVFEAFGPQRLMWASDSPYQLQGENTYQASISLVRDHLDFLSNEDRQWLLAKTAERVFFT